MQMGEGYSDEENGAMDDAIDAGLGSGALKWKDNILEKAAERFMQGRAQNLMHVVYGKGAADAEPGEAGDDGMVTYCRVWDVGTWTLLKGSMRGCHCDRNDSDHRRGLVFSGTDEEEFFKIRKPETSDTGLDELETSRFVVGEDELKDWANVDVCFLYHLHRPT